MNPANREICATAATADTRNTSRDAQAAAVSAAARSARRSRGCRGREPEDGDGHDVHQRREHGERAEHHPGSGDGLLRFPGAAAVDQREEGVPTRAGVAQRGAREPPELKLDRGEPTRRRRTRPRPTRERRWSRPRRRARSGRYRPRRAKNAFPPERRRRTRKRGEHSARPRGERGATSRLFSPPRPRRVQTLRRRAVPPPIPLAATSAARARGVRRRNRVEERLERLSVNFHRALVDVGRAEGLVEALSNRSLRPPPRVPRPRSATSRDVAHPQRDDGREHERVESPFGRDAHVHGRPRVVVARLRSEPERHAEQDHHERVDEGPLAERVHDAKRRRASDSKARQDPVGRTPRRGDRDQLQVRPPAAEHGDERREGIHAGGPHVRDRVRKRELEDGARSAPFVPASSAAVADSRTSAPAAAFDETNNATFPSTASGSARLTHRGTLGETAGGAESSSSSSIPSSSSDSPSGGTKSETPSSLRYAEGSNSRSTRSASRSASSSSYASHSRDDTQGNGFTGCFQFSPTRIFFRCLRLRRANCRIARRRRVRRGARLPWRFPFRRPPLLPPRVARAHAAPWRRLLVHRPRCSPRPRFSPAGPFARSAPRPRAHRISTPRRRYRPPRNPPRPAGEVAASARAKRTSPPSPFPAPPRRACSPRRGPGRPRRPLPRRESRCTPR